jgi:hypothetical protein
MKNPPILAFEANPEIDRATIMPTTGRLGVR